MKKIITLALILSSALVYSQNKNDELAVVKAEPIQFDKAIETKIEIFKVLPVLSFKESILKGFKTGSTALISKYFSQNIDITVNENENLYSKSQAEQVLKTFFEENKPSNFSIIHQGKSNLTKYYISSLTTNKGQFRITINTKITNNKELITHLTIEADD